MPELWIPGAVKDPQPGGVPLNRDLPSRMLWHATADRLDAARRQPPIGNVHNYLKREAYCPHLLWDPFDGYMVQTYPADVGARALSRWNEDGYVNLQVEVYFSAGMIRDGVRYDTIPQTPCEGLDRILAWADSWGIPRVWPIGEPNGRRQDNTEVWNTQAGHYAHAQVPGENHVDPGPMPSLAEVAAPIRPLLIPDVEGLYA